MVQVSSELRVSDPVACYLHGDLVWLIEYEELIDGFWKRFGSIYPRTPGHSYAQDAAGDPHCRALGG
jgi:hypothetical protein